MSTPSHTHREVTASAVVLGLILGVALNATITYGGLKLGFNVGGSAIAAVVGFGVLRWMLDRGTIVETNITQTLASAVTTPSSGVIFTVPVLFLMGMDIRPDGQIFWCLTLACVAGGILGCALIIPLRRQMIDVDRLRFPSGWAVAEVLRSPGAGLPKYRVLLAGCLLGALIYFPAVSNDLRFPWIEAPGEDAAPYRLLGYADLAPHDDSVEPDIAAHGRLVTNESVNIARLLHNGLKQIGLSFPLTVQILLAISPLAFGAGYVTGRPGLLVLAGGVLAFVVINPLAYGMGFMPAWLPPQEASEYGHSAINRPLGVGMLLGGTLMAMWYSLPTLKAAMRMLRERRPAGIDEVGDAIPAGNDELEWPVIVAAVAISLVCIYAATFYAAQMQQISRGGLLEWIGIANPYARAIILTVAGAAWIWFAAVMVTQCNGMSDWSPVSGMALLTVVLVMALTGTANVLGAVLMGATLCVAVSCAADLMQDLRTGHRVGAVPRKQQLVALMSCGVAPVISMLVLLLIVQANRAQYGVPLGPGTPTPAPQAQSLQVVVEGIRQGELPYAVYAMGAAIGTALGYSAFPGLGVLVGLSMYLPLPLIATFGLGCLANMLVCRWKGRDWSENWGVPFCAGLLVGESLIALGARLLALATGFLFT